MNKSMNEAIFDTYLEMAFEENMRKEAEEAPSKEELDKLFPIQKKYRKKLLRAIKENKYKKPLCLVYLRRAAIIALVCFSALAGGMLTSQDVRAVLKATILEWFDKYITLDFTESVDNNNFPTDVNEVHYEYIPEGYSLRYKIDDPECKMYIISNEYYCYSNIRLGQHFVIDYSGLLTAVICICATYAFFSRLIGRKFFRRS